MRLLISRLSQIILTIFIITTILTSVTAFISHHKHSQKLTNGHFFTSIAPYKHTTTSSILESIPKTVSENDRDDVICKVGILTAAMTVFTSVYIPPAFAAITAEVTVKGIETAPFVLLSDELEVVFNEAYLGIGLKEMEYTRGSERSTRVGVQSVKSDADEVVKSLVKPGMIMVAVNGKNLCSFNIHILHFLCIKFV